LPAEGELCALCEGEENLGVPHVGPSAECVARIQRAGAWLRLAGVMHLLGGALTFAFVSYLNHVWRIQGWPTEWFPQLAAVQVLAGIILGRAVIWGAQGAHALRNPGAVRRAAWLAMLPISPAVLVGLPAGWWMLRVLDQPEALEEFLKAEKKLLAQQIYEEEQFERRPLSESPWHALGWIVRHTWRRLLILVGGLICSLLALGSWSERHVLPLADDGPHRLLTGLAGLGLAAVTCATFKDRFSASRGVGTLMTGVVAGFAAGLFLMTLPAPARWLPYVAACVGAGLSVIGIVELRQGVRSGKYF
jgi:hypothetical protein